MVQETLSIDDVPGLSAERVTLCLENEAHALCDVGWYRWTYAACMVDFQMRAFDHQPSAVVILERCDDAPVPDYPVKGQASCMTCASMVWLSEQTAMICFTGAAAPLCIQCATLLGPSVLKLVDAPPTGDG